MPLLEVDSVSKTWPGAREPVLGSVSFSVEPGAFAVVQGPNGAGKTTLMRIIAGMLDPDRGELRIGSLDGRARRREFQREIGMASAGNTGLYARLSAVQNLAFGARISLVQRGRRQAAVRESVERFGLGAFAFRRVDRLSMGQRQRVRLAAAFLHEPTIVLLDEPATSLDEDGLAVLAEAIRRHGDDGRGVVWFGPQGERRVRDPDLTLWIADGALAPYEAVS
jgi:ABC-type multidrug transport system ATPase subunit